MTCPLKVCKLGPGGGAAAAVCAVGQCVQNERGESI
jgi:hypothetical protein